LSDVESRRTPKLGSRKSRGISFLILGAFAQILFVISGISLFGFVVASILVLVAFLALVVRVRVFRSDQPERYLFPVGMLLVEAAFEALKFYGRLG
jgi:uncharacterized membrane protein